jgi:hypothetical protein
MRFGLRHFVLFALIGAGICSTFGCSSRGRSGVDAVARPRVRERGTPDGELMNDEPDGSVRGCRRGVISGKLDAGSTGRGDAAESGARAGGDRREI